MASLRNTHSKGSVGQSSQVSLPRGTLVQSLNPGVMIRGDEDLKPVSSSCTERAKTPDLRREHTEYVAKVKVPLWKPLNTTIGAEREKATAVFVRGRIDHELERETTLADIEQFEYAHGLRHTSSPRHHRIEQLHMLQDLVKGAPVDETQLMAKSEVKLERWKQEAKRAHSADRILNASSLVSFSHTQLKTASSQTRKSGSFYPTHGPSSCNLSFRDVRTPELEEVSQISAPISMNWSQYKLQMAPPQSVEQLIRERKHEQLRKEYSEFNRLVRLDTMKYKMQQKREEAFQRGEYFARKKAWNSFTKPPASSKTKLSGADDLHEKPETQFTLQEEMMQLEEFRQKNGLY